MKAILTKYLGQTNTKPARIVATAAGVKHLIMSYERSEKATGMTTEDVHKRVAQILCEKYGWSIDLIGGELPDGKGFAFVFRER
jgi:hypothetical protein